MKPEADGGVRRAIVALSGGVDSAVAAALLLDAGWEVEAVSLRLWDSPRGGDRICSDWRDAGRVASHLGIPHAVLDRRDIFEKEVVTPFVEEIAAGRTPNPCMACNSRFKLGDLLRWADARGASHVATGHYARIAIDDVGVARLRRGRDPRRDQSYFLFQLAAADLSRTLFPLGDLTKDEVRDLARARALPVAEKGDSQDLCFGLPRDLVAARGRAGGAGEIVDLSGTVVGQHRGIERFTVGQRRGLGVSYPRPLYVQSTDPDRSRVVVAPARPATQQIVVGSYGPDTDRLRDVAVQIRHQSSPHKASVVPIGSRWVEVRFEAPVVAATPGQAAVVYRGDLVMGGGWIEAGRAFGG